jgi:hypothetical protein
MMNLVVKDTGVCSIFLDACKDSAGQRPQLSLWMTKLAKNGISRINKELNLST